MVFIGLGLGLMAGIALPFMVPYDLHMFLSSSFLRPHLQFYENRQKLHKDVATPTHMLDTYLKDIFKSSLMFFVFIGPAIYKIYIKKQSLTDEKDEDELFEKNKEISQRFIAERQKQTQKQEMRQMKEEDHQQIQQENQIAKFQEQTQQNDQQEAQQQKITFEEYEAFLQKSQQENNSTLSELKMNNQKLVKQLRDDQLTRIQQMKNK